VILYSNGVAYFERRGMVRGRAEVELEFKQSQVDDVLKSMVVLDLGQGRIGTVSYNSSQTAASTPRRHSLLNRAGCKRILRPAGLPECCDNCRRARLCHNCEAHDGRQHTHSRAAHTHLKTTSRA
jgi:hypothetical protein